MTGLIRDENGKISSTRVLLLMTTAIFGLLTVTDIYQDVTVHDATYEILRVIIGFGLGGQAVRSTIKNWKEGEA